MNFSVAPFTRCGTSPGPLQQYPWFSTGHSLPWYFPFPHPSPTLSATSPPTHPPYTLQHPRSLPAGRWTVAGSAHWRCWLAGVPLLICQLARASPTGKQLNLPAFLRESNFRSPFSSHSLMFSDVIATQHLGVFYPSVKSCCCWPVGYGAIRRGLTSRQKTDGFLGIITKQPS